MKSEGLVALTQNVSCSFHNIASDFIIIHYSGMKGTGHSGI